MISTHYCKKANISSDTTNKLLENVLRTVEKTSKELEEVAKDLSSNKMKQVTEVADNHKANIIIIEDENRE
ncbi:TPA: hypothetical protein ACGO5V_000465 [Streptococcus suis]